MSRVAELELDLAGDAMPEDSHVSRTDVEVDGIAMQILRRSSPYGNATELGLYFVAFACAQNRFQIQLERMFGRTEDGIHDRLIEYSRAVTGSYWLTPSAEALTHHLRTDKLPTHRPISVRIRDSQSSHEPIGDPIREPGQGTAPAVAASVAVPAVVAAVAAAVAVAVAVAGMTASWEILAASRRKPGEDSTVIVHVTTRTVLSAGMRLAFHGRMP